MAKKPSRSDRWAAAVSKAQSAHTVLRGKVEELEHPLSQLAEAMAEIRAVQEEYEEWQGNMPESMQSGATFEKLEAITQIDIDSHTDLDLSNISNLEEISDALDECENADLPSGFGRD